MITYCKRCIYPDSKPDLLIDEEGICSACRSFEKRKDIDWEERRDEVAALLERGKNDSGFDCIVPSSGGKDSHWQVLALIEMGVRPLVVTATTCHLTDIGRANIDNLSRYATTIEVTPNRTVRAKLNRLGLNLIGDISYPEHLSIFSVPFQVACHYGIPLIFYGECPQEAYGGPPGADEARTMTRRWVSEYGGLIGLRCSDLVGTDGLTERDVLDYALPSDKTLEKNKIEAHFLGQYMRWNSRLNGIIAVQNGMKTMLPSAANWWEAENQDNAQIGLHDHMMYRKFGYGRATAQLSVDIRQGIISRVEALEHVWRDGVFPSQYMGVSVEDILERIEVTKEAFDTTLLRFTNKSIFDIKENGEATLREPVS